MDLGVGVTKQVYFCEEHYKQLFKKELSAVELFKVGIAMKIRADVLKVLAKRLLKKRRKK